MSDITSEPASKPIKPPSLISLSFGGFNSIAIFTSAISILRLITAHSTITLHGIVADVIEWYKKFFHESFDIAVDWVNALNIHWIHLPHVPDDLKDIILITLLIYVIPIRALIAIGKRLGERYTIKTKVMFPFFIIYLPLRLSLTRKRIGNDYLSLITTLITAILLQIFATAFAIGSMLILSAYS